MFDTKGLKDRTDIVEIISSYIDLKKGKGCCPFHGEKTPSFSVNRSKQFYHCFGCGAHGDVIDFVVNYENVSFKEAVNILGGETLSSDMANKRKEAQEAIKSATLEAYYQAKEFECHFYFVLTGEKYTKENIKLLDLSQERIRNYELKFPWVRKTERYKNEVKFWNKTMQIDARFEMLAHYTANQLMTMKNYGKSKAEISKAFNSIANKSTYGNVTLKNKVVYLMQHPELIEVYSISDLHIKNHADSICKLKTREERIKMLADVPEQYQEGVAELVKIQFKLNKLC